MAKKILLGLLSLFILIQFFRPSRNLSTAPEPDDIFSHYPASENIKAMIKTSCYDCHSNDTRYPWYAGIQPLAWWLDHHIEEGKGELNFSDFAAFNIRYKSHKLDEIMEVINEREMPLTSYLLIHSGARLTDAQRKEIVKWADELREVIKPRDP
ncbi:MAG: heme-binding domain-containing protein [Phormidesmis sp. FL-bin-119]|nr:heme-binding domain-containing protein [Pedobacter sp.]